jgi:hypothetical protein
MLAQANIGPMELGLFSLADDAEEAVEIIRAAHGGRGLDDPIADGRLPGGPGLDA